MTSQILLFTDFGHRGPYVGQLKSVLRAKGPNLPVINLMDDAPRGDPRHAAYLLAALLPQSPADSLWLCVVDPGVGGPRHPLMVRVDGRWLVGPDNGLLAQVCREALTCEPAVIAWQPDRLSASFHGRDLFAPVAAGIARGKVPASTPLPKEQLVGWNWPSQLAEVIYIDGFGNAFTGIRGEELDTGLHLEVSGRSIGHAPTFEAVAAGTPFWYVNSCGLVEVAVNGGSAAHALGLVAGTPIRLIPD